MKEVIVSNYTFTLPHALVSSSLSSKKLCPFTFSHEPYGYWYPVSNCTRSFTTPSWHMETFTQTELEQFDLQYEPASCRLLDSNSVRDCVNGVGRWKRPLRVCSFGDSSMRHIHNSLDTLYDDRDNFFYWAASKKEKGIKTSSFANFSYDEWGACFRNSKKCRHRRPMNCEYVLINIGSWQAYYSFSPEEYGYAVAEMLVLGKQRVAPRKLLWITTHPNGDMLQSYAQPPKELRTHSLLSRYNDLARELCRNHSVDFIDVYNVASVLSDLSYDGFHYKLPVEREVARVVAHELCTLSAV
eukprot:CAMPEP_0182436784 /NCGR_PEP_ID=MMETSP1167-20130531/83579_1 /TAXON_ID=2988 /ORGANISM="Mallomonas Sp, Strain CCMP3275" /LENGTH=298 /DNA_ID=CAMNT_0024629323 /DNA_START=417 /DNA_END=1313 /DNA_ORIENTATION=-